LFRSEFYTRIEKILGRKHIYLPHAQTAIYDSKVKLFLKQGISSQLGRGWMQFFDLNARIQQLTWSLIFYEKYSTSQSYLWFWPPLILGFSNFCRYYTRSQTGKSTAYRPTLKPLIHYYRRKHDNLIDSEINIFWSKNVIFLTFFQKKTENWPLLAHRKGNNFWTAQTILIIFVPKFPILYVLSY
jgi:hypothetical protein